MKRFTKFFFSIFTLVLLVGTGYNFGAETGALTMTALWLASSLTQIPTGVAAMALQKEIWISDIQEKLFAGNNFVKAGTNDTVHLNNRTVHIPQSGVIQDVIKNPSVYPLPVAERADEDYTYDIDEYAIPPTLIRDAEQVELSYAKRSSLLEHKMKKLNAKMGDTAVEKYALADISTDTNENQFVYTSGDNGSNNNPARGAARKKMVVADLHKLMTKILEQDALTDGDRINMLLPPIMLEELRQDLDKNNHRLIAERAPIDSLGNYAGFNIYSRSKTAIYSGSDAFKEVAVTSSTAADNHAAIVWVESMVSYAQGAIEVYEDANSAAYQGDMLSARVRFGANRRRKDGIGLYAIIQQS